MKKLFFTIAWLVLLLSRVSLAQVSKTTVVEHFTNTSCSVCATNNNQYYNIISSYQNVVHLSFHPSSPYSNDFFNLQNQAENDGRTNFYGVYGSTPRLVVNGLVIPNNTLNNALAGSRNELANFEVHVIQTQISPNSFDVTASIKKVAADTLSNARLFLGVYQDTVYQPTNNGEVNHYHIFRKALTAINGITLMLPQNIGDSITSTYNYTALSSWNLPHLYVVGLLQKADKSMINAGKTNRTASTVTSTADVHAVNDLVYPNPSTDGYLMTKAAYEVFQLYTSSGQLEKTLSEVYEHQKINVSDLAPGLYLLRTKQGNRYSHQKIILR